MLKYKGGRTNPITIDELNQESQGTFNRKPKTEPPKYCQLIEQEFGRIESRQNGEQAMWKCRKKERKSNEEDMRTNAIRRHIAAIHFETNPGVHVC